jgi:D-serine deaminase-like pyridoxal phosphate-dependent protein
MPSRTNFLREIDTPALVLDLDVLDSNIARMQAFFADKNARLRPHFKTHKCPEIVRKQLAAGAKGITCAKAGEAEVLAAAGVEDILIANQIIGEKKIARLVELARRADITVAVDDAANVKDLAAAASAAGVTLGVLVEVDIGMKRCGVRAGRPAVELARSIAKQKGLEYRGLQGYEGHLVANEPGPEKTKAVLDALSLLTRTRDALIAAGLPPREVSGGGTGTYALTGSHPVMTEIQAGSYATMDAKYAKIVPEFGKALFCAVTVVSKLARNRAVGDAGLKAITSEFGMPEVASHSGVKVERLAEEHTVFSLTARAADLRIGDKLLLVPSHGCTTFNLHDRVYGIRKGRIECTWAIAARGKVT